MYLITGFSLFLAEVRLLSAVKHKNLIGLVGYCEEPGNKYIKGKKLSFLVVLKKLLCMIFIAI